MEALPSNVLVAADRQFGFSVKASLFHLYSHLVQVCQVEAARPFDLKVKALSYDSWLCKQFLLPFQDKGLFLLDGLSIKHQHSIHSRQTYIVKVVHSLLSSVNDLSNNKVDRND